MRTQIVSSQNRKWWTLGAVAVGLFMIMLDNTVVNVALPSIQRDLDAKLPELEWIVAGYALTFAALLLTGGKLADLLGRRLIFVIGLGVFAGSSLACALAPSAEFLVGGRVIQGAGAALMNPASLSIISAAFPPRQRGTAIGIWVGISATALAVGPLVGGLLTKHAGWSSIFFVNVPIGVLAIVASLLLIDETKDTSREQRVDLPGLFTSGLGLFALTFGLIEANSYGWSSGRIVGAFVVAAVALTAFVVLELRQRLPMLDLSLFRSGHLHGRQHGAASRGPRHVRRLLLHLAVHAEHPRLLRRPGGCRVPSAHPARGLHRSHRGQGLRSRRISLAARDRDVGRRLSLVYLSRLGVQESYWSLLPACSSAASECPLS